MKKVFYAVAMFITIACVCNPSVENYFIALSMILAMSSVIVRDINQMCDDNN